MIKAFKLHKKVLIPVLSVAVIALGYGGLEFTMTPRFCGSCHNMKVYYHEWQSSKHKDVACVECHIEPGFTNLVKRKIAASYELVSVITGKIPSRLHSDVRDVVCFRPGCHTPQKMEEPKTIAFGKSVRFDHSTHLGDTPVGKLRCTVCHSQRGEGDHVGLNTEACVLCHYKLSIGGGTQ